MLTCKTNKIINSFIPYLFNFWAHKAMLILKLYCSLYVNITFLPLVFCLFFQYFLSLSCNHNISEILLLIFFVEYNLSLKIMTGDFFFLTQAYNFINIDGDDKDTIFSVIIVSSFPTNYLLLIFAYIPQNSNAEVEFLLCRTIVR